MSGITTEDLGREAKFPTSIPRQMYLTSKRALLTESRDRVTNIGILLQTFVLACIIGTLFLRLGHVQVGDPSYSK